MKGRKNAQKKVTNELKNQLLIQAERLGIKDDYSPLVMEELKLGSIGKILTEFYMERANLEYEMSMLGSNKREVLIKLERLHAYIRKAQGLQEKHNKQFETIIEKGTGDQVKTQRAVRKLQTAKVRASA